MTNLSNLDGLLSCILVLICSCVFLRRVKAMEWLFAKNQFGPVSLLHKASVIGSRLATPLACAATALAIVIILR